MPTRTKPKRPIDLLVTPVAIPLRQRTNIAESAGLDHTSRAGKEFLRDVTQKISWHKNQISRVPLRSLPAHSIANLRPILKLAAELANAVHQERLPIEVSALLGDDVMTGAMHATLAELAGTIRRAIAEVEGQGGPGVLGSRLKIARERALADLVALYQNLARDSCDANDQAEFLEVCGKLIEPRYRAGTKRPLDIRGRK